MPKPAPSILVIAHDDALRRRLLRDLRILGFPTNTVSRLGIAAVVLQLRGFELILIESATRSDVGTSPLLVEDGQVLQTTPRLWIGDGRGGDELPADISRGDLDFEITQKLDRRGSGNFLPARPTRSRAVRELLSLLDRTGIESMSDARLAGIRAGMTAAAYGLGRRERERCALSAMLRRTGLLCVQSAAIDMELVDPVWAAREVLNAIPSLLPVCDPILCYREHWDGSGRPNGWSGCDWYAFFFSIS